jgi:hypothetical protein
MKSRCPGDAENTGNAPLTSPSGAILRPIGRPIAKEQVTTAMVAGSVLIVAGVILAKLKPTDPSAVRR